MLPTPTWATPSFPIRGGGPQWPTGPFLRDYLLFPWTVGYNIRCCPDLYLHCPVVRAWLPVVMPDSTLAVHTVYHYLPT